MNVHKSALHWIIVLLLPASLAVARPPTEGEFQAASNLGVTIAKWIKSQQREEGKPIAIFAVNVNDPLDADYSNLFEKEVLKASANLGVAGLSSCIECRSPQVKVEGENVIISKGQFELETLKSLGKTQKNTDSFLVIDLYRTNFSVVAQVVLYQNPTAVIIASARFTENAMTITNSSVQLLLTFGLGKVLSGKSPGDTSYATAANLLLLEEVGFAKAGLNLGIILGGAQGSCYYANPTLAFRGHFGASSLGWSFMTGLGYGLTTEAKGITLRMAYEVYMGSWAEMGVEYLHLLPDVSEPTLKSFIGLHIGIAFGR